MHNHLAPEGLSIRCERHPAYRAIRPPRAECEACQWLYENKGKLMMCVAGEQCIVLDGTPPIFERVRTTEA